MRKRILSLVLCVALALSCFGSFGVMAAEQTMDFDKAYTMLQEMSEYLLAQSPQDRDYLYNWVHSYMKTDLGVDALIKLVDDQSEAEGNNVVLNYIFSFGTDEASKSNLRFALALAKTVPTDARAKAFDDMKQRKAFSLVTTAAQDDAIEAVYDKFISDEYKDMLNHEQHMLNKLVVMQFLADFNKTFVITDGIDAPENFELYNLNDEFKSKLEAGELKAKYDVVNGVDWQTGEEFIKSLVESANESASFTGENAEMKENFKTVLGINGVDMYVKRVFEVSATGVLEQAVGNTSDIKFVASSNITTDDLTKVEWYVGDEKVFEGEEFIYNPSALAAGDSAVVKAKLGAYEQSYEVKVVAAPSFTLGITAAGELNQTVGSTTQVTFTANTDPAGEDLSNTVWYVNGQAQELTGESFDFTPSQKGTYVVYAVLGGAKSNEITVDVAGVYGAFSITSTGKLEQVKNEYYPVEFEATSENELIDLKEAKWYVNGVYQDVQNDKFTFTPSSVGSFEVKAVLPDGTESVNTITVKVKLPVSRPSGSGLSTPSKDEPKEPDYSDISKPIIPPTETGKVTKFKDIEGHWSEPYMEALYEKGIFAGTSETEMNPDWGITRQEVAVLLVRLLGFENEKPQGKREYTDDDEIADWAYDSVHILSDRGIYVGYGDGSFQPERIISRQELVSVIGRQLTGKYEIELDYTDKGDIYFWAVEHVEELTAFGIVQGFEDESFRPEHDVTRAQAAVMFYNTMYRLGMFRVQL